MHSDTFVPSEERLGDPRRDLAISTWIYFATYFRDDPNLLRPRPVDFHWYAALYPFVTPFLPPEAKQPGAKEPPKPLGIVLTRQTAALLSDAKPPSDDASWMAVLGDRSVYIDVPHGAIRVGDTLQLRAIFLSKLVAKSGDLLMLIGVVTDRGSEQGRGRILALLDRNGHPMAAVDEEMNLLTELALLPPFTDPEVEPIARARTADFLRLTLAYHFFGPKETHEPITVTATNRLRQGKPRKDESLFSMVRLQPASDRLGRPASSVSTGWSLTTRQEVSGHFKLQPHGPGATLRKLIWVAPYDRGPEDAPAKAHAHRI